MWEITVYESGMEAGTVDSPIALARGEVVDLDVFGKVRVLDISYVSTDTREETIDIEYVD